jgi:hypothetical protein
MRADVIVERPRETRVYRAARKPLPLLTRFGSKLVLDILPAALASVIGGILFTHFQFGRVTPTPVQQVSPASAEVLALVRDEHDAIIGYLRSQMAAETARAVADAKAELDARDKAGADLAAAEIKLASAASVRAGGAPAPQMKVALPRAKPANPAVRAPLVIAQAGQQAGQPAGQNVPQNEASAASDRLARDPDSLLAKTLDLKDQVVAATRHAAAAIGDVFASVSERFGGPAPTTRQFSSDS